MKTGFEITQPILQDFTNKKLKMKELREKILNLDTRHKDLISMGLLHLIVDNLDKIDKQKLIDYVHLEINDKNSRHFGKDLKTVAEKHNKGYLKFVDKTIGFDVVRLGWKYKFDSIRFEWNPMFSFVFFGLQFCVFIAPKNDRSYWESWIYYNEHTDKNKPTLERLKQCIEEAPQRWTRYHNGEKSSIDYYKVNLKNKWIKLLH